MQRICTLLGQKSVTQFFFVICYTLASYKLDNKILCSIYICRYLRIKTMVFGKIQLHFQMFISDIGHGKFLSPPFETWSHLICDYPYSVLLSFMVVLLLWKSKYLLKERVQTLFFKVILALCASSLTGVCVLLMLPFLYFFQYFKIIFFFLILFVFSQHLIR